MVFLYYFPLPIYPNIDVIFVNDTKMFQSINGEIEYLDFPILCPHEVVCHDSDETLGIITHPIQDVLLCHFIELNSIINHQIQYFHFLFILPVRKIYPYSIVVLVDVEVLLDSFLIHPFLLHVPIQGVQKNQFNTLTLVLLDDQLEELKRFFDETNKKNVPYKEGEGEIRFKVKLNPNTKILDSNNNPIKIDIRNVPCVDLRDYKDAIIDIVLTGESKEFKRRATKKFIQNSHSYPNQN